MKTLYLLRHAKAEPGSATLGDEDRPLSARGRAACRDMGEYMKEKAYLPALTLCSTSIRTRETLERVALAYGTEFPCRFERKLYLAAPGEMLAFVQDTEERVESLMLVGHNPGMHHLAALLASPEHTALREKLEIKYPTGALCVLQFDGLWSSIAPEACLLHDFTYPNDL